MRVFEGRALRGSRALMDACLATFLQRTHFLVEIPYDILPRDFTHKYVRLN
jgi:hypothetical protein